MHTPHRAGPLPIMLVTLAALVSGACSPAALSSAPASSMATASAATPAPSPSTAPSSAPASAAGGRTVTLADDATTVQLAVGDRFLLALGTGFDWTVTVADPSIVDRVRNISVVVGAQGVYEARAPGSTTLTAIGDPPCRKSMPPCAAPSRSFRVDIVVR